jgi:hypothetical protein
MISRAHNFSPITDADWTRSLRVARATPNIPAMQIRLMHLANWAQLNDAPHIAKAAIELLKRLDILPLSRSATSQDQCGGRSVVENPPCAGWGVNTLPEAPRQAPTAGSQLGTIGETPDSSDRSHVRQSSFV